MDIKILKENEYIPKEDCIIINIITKDRLMEILEHKKKYSKTIISMLQKAFDIREFTGEVGEAIILYPDNVSNIHFFIGLGDRDSLNPRTFQNCGAILAKKFSNFHVKEAFLDLSTNENIDPFFTIKAFLEGIAIGAYTFSKYFTKKTPFPLGKMSIIIHKSVNSDETRTAIEDASINISASNIARYLTNEAANNKTPDKFEKIIRKHFNDEKYNIKVLDHNDLKKENLNLISAVGQAGSELPKLCIIEYITDKNKPILGMVGKAVTFDSGGLMIKAKGDLPHMREDVGGAAALIGALSVLHRLDLNYNIVGAIPIAENLIDSRSFRPSDIIITRNNISVEITNTDAEGRLMIADSFLYLQNYYNLSAIIDIATLTGAITRALGKKIAGYFTNSPYIKDLFSQAYHRSLEKFWQMPLEQEYMHNLKSQFADIKNDGGEPKAISAAMFLSYFIKNRLPWLHLDVGSCIVPGSNDILYGSHDYANGIPAITLIELFRILEETCSNLVFNEADR